MVENLPPTSVVCTFCTYTQLLVSYASPVVFWLLYAEFLHC